MCVSERVGVYICGHAGAGWEDVRVRMMSDETRGEMFDDGGSRWVLEG